MNPQRLRSRHPGAGRLGLAVLVATLFALPAVAFAQTKTSGATRTEHDLLGDKQIPADAYYGVQTARALENFKLSGVLINHYPGFVEVGYRQARCGSR